MKIKLDENLPHRLAAVLKDLGHEVDTAHEEQLVGHTDEEIWQAAQKESRFLITQDLDFSRFAPWHPPGASSFSEPREPD
jgi:predicted nuclease of predicted toxin-antitoxin system